MLGCKTSLVVGWTLACLLAVGAAAEPTRPELERLRAALDQAEARALAAERALWELRAERLGAAEVFQRAAPSVLSVTAEGRDGRRGDGAGFVWDGRGHVVTNYHVVQDARSIVVAGPDQTPIEAALVAVDVTFDLAVLRLPRALTPPPLALGSSERLRVGDPVYAIGNPHGLSASLSRGIVSGLGRTVSTPGGALLRGAIQTDAAVNPGNSGGPLLDGRGEVVGIATAILSPTGASSGIAFAMPIELARAVVPRLAESRARPWLGLGLSVLEQPGGPSGLMVAAVEPDGPAARAGLSPGQAGDLITHVDGRPAASADDIAAAVRRAGAGGQVRLTVVRGESRRDVELTVANLR